MHIEVHGNGPDLVMIHGWAMHSGIFAPLTRALAQHFRVHLVDLPGHGASRADAGSLAPVACAARIAAATPPALWLGWSLGGQIALQAALDTPAAVQALVLVGASPRFTTAADWPHAVDAAVFADFADGLRHDYRRTIERFLALEAHGSDHAQAELRDLKAQVFAHGEPALAALCEGLDVLAQTDLRDRLAALTMPSLWIAGRRDRLVPAAALRWSAQQNRHAQYLELAGGHAPFLAHAPTMAAQIQTLRSAVAA